MISDDTLHAVRAVLEAEAAVLEVAAHLAAENHNQVYAEAKLARAARLRGYIAEIHAHLTAPAAAPGDDAIQT
jgi:hypothetical protein